MSLIRRRRLSGSFLVCSGHGRKKKQSGKEAICESLIYYGLETELNTFLVMVLAAS